MAKKAKVNVVSGDHSFEAGKVYDDALVAHLDPSDFEDVADAPAEEVKAPVADATVEQEAEKKADSQSATPGTEDAQPVADAQAPEAGSESLE
jgi:hypothetical protein